MNQGNNVTTHDVFLSHSSVDKDWVAHLKEALEQYGIKSWLDKDEIRPGVRVAEALEAALERCSTVVLVVTNNAISSGWVKAEYYRALSLIGNSPGNIELIPVIKSKASIPGFLADRNHVDFTVEEEYNKNVWKLAWGIKKEKPRSIIDVSGSMPASKSLLGTEESNQSVNASLLSLPHTGKLASALLYDVQKLIALHGVDDDTWSQAISSQYFLAGIARALGLTDQDDYKRLLNIFLSSFHHQIDETLILEKNHILVTPEELRKIVECMKEEDERDAYFAHSTKTKWNRIDAWKLHYNYLYGLAVEISNDENYKILNDIQSLAIGELIYDQKQTQLDDHGGWHPYRIPWITARILIGLKHSSIDRRPDYLHISNVINKALESLVRRIFDGKYWRSGVGDWVSAWESTALCLEALNEWRVIDEYRSKVTPVIKYAIAHEDDWLVDPPNLSTENDSNLTLASVLMACAILQISLNKGSNDDLSVDAIKYLNYLKKVVSLVCSSANQNSRQFCTIPQIAYYVVKTVNYPSR